MNPPSLPSRSTILSASLISLALFAGSACIPVATPPMLEEPTAESRERCRPILLISEQESDIEFLGLQFVFGLIPLTRVYALEHSRLVFEAELVRLLDHFGYCVFQSSNVATRAAWLQELRSPVLELQQVDSSAYAYDFLVLRRLSVGGLASLEIIGRHGSVPFRLQFERSALSRSGFASELARELRAAIRSSLESNPGIGTLKTASRATRPARLNAIVIEVKPVRTFGVELLEHLMGDFTASREPQFLAAMLERHLEQGVAEALGARVHLWQRTGTAPPFLVSQRIQVRPLDVSVAEDVLALGLELTIEKKRKILYRDRCSIRYPLNAVEQRLPVLALRPASTELFKAFFFRDTASSERVECVGR